MSTSYNPQQELAFYYNKKDKKLYLKLVITVPVDDRETLNLIGKPTLDSETNIQFEVDTTDRHTTTPYRKSVLILLMEGVTVSDNDTEGQLRKLISADMSKKKIALYTLHSKVMKAGSLQVGQGTSTISSNGKMEIE